MSKKIPFLEMFAALCRWSELAQAAEGWLIVSATIDKGERSAKLVVEGAAGAGPNLLAQVEEAVCRAYGLSAARIEAVPAPEAPPEPAGGEEPAPAPEDDPFARTEAIRRAARQRSAQQTAPAHRGEKAPQGKTIFGKAISRRPSPSGIWSWTWARWWRATCSPWITGS